MVAARPAITASPLDSGAWAVFILLVVLGALGLAFWHRNGESDRGEVYDFIVYRCAPAFLVLIGVLGLLGMLLRSGIGAARP